ncbi:hypothetical protein F1559_004673 [Cyanidiococcus yangmingshanensis]|uniref:Pru domain-containing protein n=1 Tax=Cyanidiococcus yangmingshanensis TaxID=2690220 RepID=A0A7J7IIE9_9RHOD|nr:hypothetical protein F1559_004673 [Cyanidiococcus yangmingshanensis]
MEPAAEQVLVEFRAGRAYFDSGTVRSDRRKGCVRVTRAEDGLVHFQWQDRATGTVEEDLIVFPVESNWRRVQACRTGRMFVLTFASSDLQLFFWMQEPRQDLDATLARRVRNALECRELDDPAGTDPDDEVPTDTGTAPSVRAAPAFGTTARSETVFAQALADALQRLHAGAPVEGVAATVNGVRTTEANANAPACPSLAELLGWRPELELALREPALQAASSALLHEYLPDGFDLESVLRSAAFRQQLRALSEALRRSRGDARPLFEAFGIEPPAGNWPNDLEALIEALRRRSHQAHP